MNTENYREKLELITHKVAYQYHTHYNAFVILVKVARGSSLDTCRRELLQFGINRTAVEQLAGFHAWKRGEALAMVRT